MTTTTRRLTIGLAAAALIASTTAATSFAHEASNTAAVVKTRNPSPLPQVTNLRYASHGTSSDGYDRVVIDMTGSAPGYNVRYVTGASGCGSGASMYVPGTKFLQVTLTPAQAHTDEGKNTYVGPGQTSSKAVSLPTLKGIRKTCDFEGYVTFVLGLDHKAGFHVTTLSNPTRIYVDLRH